MLLRNIRLRDTILFLADSCSILFFCYLVYFESLGGEKAAAWYELIWEFAFITLLCQVVIFINGLHKHKSKVGLIDLSIKVMVTVISIICTLTIYYLSFPSHLLGGGLYLYVMLLTFLSMLGWRVSLKWFVGKLDLTEKVLILGSGSLARILIYELQKKENGNYKLEGLISNYPEQVGKKIMGQEVIGNQKDILSVVSRKKINKIVIAQNQRRSLLPVTELLACKLRGTKIVDTPDFYEQLTGKILIKDLRPSWLIFSAGFRKTNTLRIIKRLMDITFSFLGLIVFLPIGLVTAMIVKLDSSGPVLFTQTRVGEYGKPYTIYKFRSMTSNAEEESGPIWADVDDYRVTRFGRVIRKMRIDEIPQIINVLKGEMSIVGPRPEREFFIDQLQKRIPYYTQRLMVKPGITGWSAVNAQYTSSIEAAVEKLQYDLYYVKNMSFYMDLLIILKTVKIILTGKGSR